LEISGCDNLLLDELHVATNAVKQLRLIHKDAVEPPQE
jgi:hypothetical protein